MRRIAALPLVFLLLGAAPTVNQAALMADAPAARLSAYRLYDAAGRPIAGVQPYTLNTPLFSDMAEKARAVWMPPGTSARYSASGVLEFPVGTALIKTFAFPADFRQPAKNMRVIETRLLIRKASGWVPVSYVWQGSDAVLKRAGQRVAVAFVDSAGAGRQIDYAVPNENQCKQCHLAGDQVTPIGPTAGNLNGALRGHDGNQLLQWAASGRLQGLPANLPANLPRLARWDDPSEPLAERARAYLDVNCGHCHDRAGFASNSGLYLRHDEAVPAHLGLWKRPVAAGRGSGGRTFAIVPGDPDASILVHRMESSEPGVMMPQFGRSMAHAEGVALVRAWIAAMPRAPAP
ncbi:SO2930 family diheme c-type cytochrome [Sandarakinorhabdus sp.]|uniref:SO2930 family diheme c-type cytochrome n=1 Tax=Sandarakinorhabdus sp. TaxID=1916663 RepID=UPI00286E0326|nr:SO2930 family diheme c-type cytochrome [Sandarakinorhabdus sp.]